MTHDPNRSATEINRGINRTADQASNTIEDMRGRAQETTSDLRDKAQDVAGDVKDKAQQLGAQVADKADVTTTAVGEKLTDVAQTLRERAPASGSLGDAADTAADTLQRAGTYLQQQDLSDIRADLEGIVRRHPMESLLVGLGLGYLLARSMRR
jgi:ElaB/YqjD/DUF883 family membrane-anchored ribosome-binding protein